MVEKYRISKLIVFIIFFSILLSSAFYVKTYAINVNELGNRIDANCTLINGVDDAKDTAKKIIANSIIGMQYFGIGVSVIILSVLGIKFMIGSIEERAQIKKHLVNFTIGAIVFFSATTLVRIFQEFVIEASK